MTYETMDWEAEAKRVARAFGFGIECWFQEYLAPETQGGDYFLLKWNGELPEALFSKRPEVNIVFSYNKVFGRQYLVFSNVWDLTGVSLDWDGTILVYNDKTEFAPLLAKGLFNLGLLSPEIEATLQVSITAHQKMEWAREFGNITNGGE